MKAELAVVAVEVNAVSTAIWPLGAKPVVESTFRIPVPGGTEILLELLATFVPSARTV